MCNSLNPFEKKSNPRMTSESEYESNAQDQRSSSSDSVSGSLTASDNDAEAEYELDADDADIIDIVKSSKRVQYEHSNCIQVNLFRKLPLKFKKQEYSPNPQAQIHSLKFKASALKNEFEVQITHHSEPLAKLSFSQLEMNSLDISDSAGQKAYARLKSDLISLSETTHVDIHDALKFSPDADIDYLNTVVLLLEKMKCINTNSYKTPSQNSRRNSDKTSQDSSCIECAIELTTSDHHYIHLKTELMLCDHCFVEGLLGMPYVSSRDFKYVPGVPGGYPISEFEYPGRDDVWSDDQVLTLLTYLEATKSSGADVEWEECGAKCGRDAIAARLKFASISSASYTNESIPSDTDWTTRTQEELDVIVDGLYSFVKDDINPIMSLISLIGHAVHPQLTAKIAQTALAAILSSTGNSNLEYTPSTSSSEPLPPSINHPACISSIRAVLAEAIEINGNLQIQIDDLMLVLCELKIKRNHGLINEMKSIAKIQATEPYLNACVNRLWSLKPGVGAWNPGA